MTDLTASEAGSRVEALLAEALSYHRAGKLTEAERHYADILQHEEKNPQVLTLLGTLLAQRGNFEEAITQLRRSLAIDHRQPFALNSLGNALNEVRLYTEAVECYERAIGLKLDNAAAYSNRGNALMALKRYEEALDSCDRAIAINPDYAQAHCRRGNVLSELQRYDEAVLSYDQAILLAPNHAEYYSNRANALRELQRYEQSLASCDQAIILDAGFTKAHFNKGLALQGLGRSEDALASYDRALSLSRDFAAGYHSRGNVLMALQRHKDALESYENAVRLDPDSAEAHNNVGSVLRTLRRLTDALSSYDRAIALKPDYAGAHVNRALVLHEMGRNREAVDSYDKAIALCPRDSNAYHMRAIALKDLGRFDEALASIEKAIELDPEQPYLLGQRLVTKTWICEWSGLQQLSDEVIAGVERGSRVSPPFPLLAVPCPENIRRKSAEIFVKDQYSVCSTLGGMPITRQESGSGRVQVAYVSGDLRAHAIGFLAAGLLEQHDRERFEIHAISFGRNDRSETRARLENAVEHFTDVRGKDDVEVATLMRERNIDIAVDLMGLTGRCRTRIFALRAAPIQVNYLGFPGTMGADYLDYIVGDKVIIPKEAQSRFVEKVVYLPDTYQCNDSRRRIAESALSRTDAGLPTNAFVFCSFNNHYKIMPEVFAMWMKILQQVEGSTLWLLGSNGSAERNLRREAESRGVSGERLVFASRLSNPEHLARHRLADLFLDTLPYGAHTTTSDALWAGLPVLTCMGESFAGRVAASLLNAIGLPEMVTHSLGEYEMRAVFLARNPSALAEIKAKLARNRESHPLFDTVRFTRHLEAAYMRMIEIHRSGQLPQAFSVEARGPQ